MFIPGFYYFRWTISSKIYQKRWKFCPEKVIIEDGNPQNASFQVDGFLLKYIEKNVEICCICGNFALQYSLPHPNVASQIPLLIWMLCRPPRVVNVSLHSELSQYKWTTTFSSCRPQFLHLRNIDRFRYRDLQV